MFLFRIAAVFLMSLFFINAAHADDVDNYVRSIVSKAKSEKVYDERAWHVLLHYKTTIFKGFYSLVDDDKFFLSPSGVTDSDSELEATIRGLFDTKFNGADDDHPYCRFPARREFLTKRLKIDESKFPKLDCAKYNTLEKKIDPKSVTLVFPFMYINRPASMFGHTLLRINNRYNDPLLAYGVTYSAILPDDPSFLDKTMKGIFGMLPGNFTIKEYYKTIYEYSNIDVRDIWEYDLNLTEAETKTLAKHLFELANMNIDYWFFDENCSFTLMFLIESARPDLMLTDAFFFEAPPDTVKRMFKDKLVKKISYRPSQAKLIENIARGMPKPAVDLGRQVGLEKLPPSAIDESDLSDRLKVAAYDLAIEIMRFEYQGKTMSSEVYERYSRMTVDILRGRAKYKMKSDYTIKTPVSPHNGHDVFRAEAGIGIENNKFYSELGIRAGFHGFEDIDDGYLPNSEIIALDMSIRYNSYYGTFKVQDATLLSIRATSPISSFSVQPSWRLQLAGEQKSFRGDGERFIPYIEGGAGVSFDIFDSVSIWGLASVKSTFSNVYKSFVGIGLGGEVGLSYSFKYGKILGEGYYRNFVLGGGGNEAAVKASYIFPVTRNNSLIASYERSYSWGIYKTDINLAWRFYF